MCLAQLSINKWLEPYVICIYQSENYWRSHHDLTPIDILIARNGYPTWK